MAKRKTRATYDYGPDEQAPSLEEFLQAYNAKGVTTRQQVLDKLKEMKRPMTMQALLSRRKLYLERGYPLQKLETPGRGRTIKPKEDVIKWLKDNNLLPTSDKRDALEKKKG